MKTKFRHMGWLIEDLWGVYWRLLQADIARLGLNKNFLMSPDERYKMILRRAYYCYVIIDYYDRKVVDKLIGKRNVIRMIEAML